MTVINQAGIPIDFRAAVLLMDDEILGELDGTKFVDQQDLFRAYENAYIRKYGIEWELSRKYPKW